MSAQVLVIDDEPNVRTMVRLVLESSGYRVKEAVDGPDGLVKYGDGEHIDLVLVDQRMPGMTGLEVQREIHQRNPNAKIILVTAFGTIELALESIQAGASDFLRKPFTADTLRQTVKSAIEKPLEKRLAVPISMVCKEFTRTTFNGFSFDVDDEPEGEHPTQGSADFVARFVVTTPDSHRHKLKVVLPGFVQELAKAHIDSDDVPGGDAFWHALCEEALADWLWQNASVPQDGIVRIDDLTRGLERWLDEVLTVELRN